MPLPMLLGLPEAI